MGGLRIIFCSNYFEHFQGKRNPTHSSFLYFTGHLSKETNKQTKTRMKFKTFSSNKILNTPILLKVSTKAGQWQ